MKRKVVLLVILFSLSIFMISSISALCYEYKNSDWPPSYSSAKLCSTVNEDIVTFSCTGVNAKLYFGSGFTDSICNEDGCGGSYVGSDYSYILANGNNKISGACWSRSDAGGYFSWVFAYINLDLNWDSCKNQCGGSCPACPPPVATCPTSYTYNASLTSEVKDCAVWQYDSKYAHCTGRGWFIYNKVNPSISSMAMTDAQYKSLAPATCWAECTQNTDCSQEVISTKECVGNSVIENKKLFVCENNKCIQKQEQSTLESCTNGCTITNSVAQCVVATCTTGEKKCSGSDILECSNNAFAVKETCTIGCEDAKCKDAVTNPTSCIEGDKKCSNNDILECVDSNFVKTETCDISCSNGTCTSETNMSTMWVIVSISGILFIIILIMVFKRRKGSKK